MNAVSAAVEPLPPDVDDVLQRFWGFDTLRPLQGSAIRAVLERRDSVVVLPTGGGKSLCFQVPALIGDDPGIALVVSPLIALMKDQVDGLVASGVPAARLDSTMSSDARLATFNGLRDGRFKLLYVSPERLMGDGGASFQATMARRGVRYVAIDEAHCISHWGHDFRPEYRQLGALRAAWPQVSMHAFTATATTRVREDIVRQLGLRDALVLVGSFDRPNLIYRVRPRLSREQQLESVMTSHRGEAGIIYCISRKDVDQTAASLADAGHKAVAYHAGLSDDERSRNQDAFIDERADVVVATVAFGMGVDRSDVRFVVHAGAPKSLEHYQQEAGRAGRDGLAAECLLLYSSADFLKWKRIMEMSGELSDADVAHLRQMERYASAFQCRHKTLVEHFGQPYEGTDCGACDVCLGEIEKVDDPLILAQKIGSCVARVKQRFGLVHVAAVLEGKSTPQVAQNGHDALSTFGLLKDLSAAEIKGYIEQLIARGFLQRTPGDYPVVELTATGVAMLKGQVDPADIVLCRQPKASTRSRSRGGRDGAMGRVERESWEGVDRDLFDALRALRLEIARGRGVPPYVVFHDSTLREMAKAKPGSMSALLHVPGVGARKAEDFGQQFLDAIAHHGG
ncbi:MAG: DNA helicase RecQ [Vicinamibacteraceae bacterium]